MKTKNTPKSTILGTFLLMYMFLFASISFGQSDHYYYHHGEKIKLELNKKILNISVFQNFQTDNLRNLKLKPYALDQDRSLNTPSELRYAKIEFETMPSDAEYQTKFQEIKNAKDLRTVYPSFVNEAGVEISLSDFIYVKLKSQSDINLLRAEASKYNLTIIEQDEYMPLWYTLRCSENTDYSSLEVANSIFETSQFLAAVPDLMTYDDIECTNDPDFNLLWGMENSGNPSADINACDAWAITKGNGANLAILDQGIELTHTDLAANLSSLSYDTESNSSPSQMFGDHGTHCAGTSGAVGDNNTQVVGVAPECTLFSISNSLGGNPNSRQKRADGFNWAVANGVDIISNSWISGVQYQVIDDAIDNALTNGRGGLGCIIVFAAGNGSGSPVSYPANYTGGILAVGSITSSGARSSFSNVGTELDVVAPGSSILSTINNNGTGYKSGTSMATPHVAGLAALILSVSPCLTGLQVNDIIEQTAQKSGGYAYNPTLGRPNGDWNNEMGYGLIDAHAAVLLAQSIGCGTTCSTTISSFPYSESFENTIQASTNGILPWEQSTNDDFDWTRNSGSTTSSQTGPTSASAGTYYAYVESSFPNYPSKTTILNSPCFDLTNQSSMTLSFQYHMYGSSMGTLDLQVSADGGTTWVSEWSLSGDQGNQWSTAIVNLNAYVGNTIQLRYVGTTSTSFRSDMAIDDIRMSASVIAGCGPLIAPNDLNETFETDFGVWQQDLTEDFDWTRNQGPTPSVNTGPASAYEGNYYAYIESSFPNNPNKSAHLVSPCIKLGSQFVGALRFRYHMYGATTGTFAVEVSIDNGATWTTEFVRVGEQSKEWLAGSIALTPYAGNPTRIRFVGKTVNGYQSDIAIDALQVLQLIGIEKSGEEVDIDQFDPDAPAVSIYPNPANDFTIVDFRSFDSEEVHVSVLNMLGQEVYQTTTVDLESHKIRIPTDAFAPGSYVVVVKGNSGERFNKKLIIRQ